MNKAVAKAKPAAKPDVKKTPATKQPAPAAKKATAAKSPAKVAEPAPAPQAAAPAPEPAMPVRSTRVSARLSSLTVPSMPPAVASTAAKSSFTQTMSTVLVPPPLSIKKDPKLANNWKTKSAEELTDDEVIAMPDSEYMNDKQMAFFRHKLVQLKKGILDNAGETTEHLREDTVVVPGPPDRHPVAGSAAAPRTQAEDVRGLIPREPDGDEAHG